MTTINNMPLMNGTGIFAAAQAGGAVAGNPLIQPGLLGFMNLLFAAVGTPATAQQATGIAPQAGAQANDLAAKIAQLMQNPPAGQKQLLNSLLKLLQGGQAAAGTQGASAQDALQKLIALLQPATQGGEIRPTLTSDLTTQAATDVQQTAAINPAIANNTGMMADAGTAALLNALEPEAGAPAAAEMPQNAEATAPLPVSAEDAAQAALNRLFNQLEKQGLDKASIEKQLVVIANLLSGTNVTQEAAAATMPATPACLLPLQEAQGEQAADAPAQKSGASAPQGLLQPGQAKAPQAQQQMPEAATSGQEGQGAQQPAQQGASAATPKTAAHPALATLLANAPATSAAPAALGLQPLEEKIWHPEEHLGDADAQAAALLKADPLHGFGHYMAAAARGQGAQPTVQMIALQLQKNAAAKIDVMTLQLDPADLGRLEIRMEFDKDGGLKAHLTADKPETLSMLRQDASFLQRTLQQAGFDMDDGSLSFDLRQQGQDQQRPDGAQDQPRGQGGTGGGYADNTVSPAQLAAQVWQGYVSPTGVNIMV